MELIKFQSWAIIFIWLISVELSCESHTHAWPHCSKQFDFERVWSLILFWSIVDEVYIEVWWKLITVLISKFVWIDNFYTIQKKMKKKNVKEFKVVMLGVSGVGKSSIIERLTKNIFSGAQAVTYGLSFLKHTINMGNTTIQLNRNCNLRFLILIVSSCVPFI